jgi:hypothetical protein
VIIIAPNKSAPYKVVRDAAALTGHDTAFRDMAMLLKAPASLTSIFLVASNVQYMLSVLPPSWPITNCFAGWAEMTEWVLGNQEALNQLGGETLKANPRLKHTVGQRVQVRSMMGFGPSEFPIYSTLCDKHELTEHTKSLALLHAQLLIARRSELERNSGYNSNSFVEQYERHGKEGDFALNVRQPDAAARAIRKISFAIGGPILEAMHPERNPEAFAAGLRTIGRELLVTEFTGSNLNNIRHYCGGQTFARPGQTRTSGNRFGGGPGVYGNIEYNDIRTGTIYPDSDPDDNSLDSAEFEVILDQSMNRGAALELNINPKETANVGALVVDNRLTTTRRQPHRLAIDTDRMPWSAFHLRTKEIAKTLLERLVTTATSVQLGQHVEDEELENCALISVCLETARPLKAAITLRYGANVEGDFLLVPSKSDGDDAEWRWQAIEPDCKDLPTHLVGAEMRRTSELSYPVHRVANTLVRAWAKRCGKGRARLFEKPQSEYNKLLTSWLTVLDGSRRLTLPRIADLKLSLLCQEAGGDLTEASQVLGWEHPMIGVPLCYSLLSTDDTRHLFLKATATLWQNVYGKAFVGPLDRDLSSGTSDDAYYTGSPIRPKMNAVKKAIRLTCESAERLSKLDFAAPLPDDFVEMFNRAVLYLVWHQAYAVAARDGISPYITLTEVCESSGVAALADKDDGTGYKTRIVWLPPILLEHMRRTELLVDQVRTHLQLDWDRGISPIFFIDGDGQAVEVRPKWIEFLSEEFFAFPSNSPRHILRFLLRNRPFPSESVEVYMGHSNELREPWGKFSSFDMSAYLNNLRTQIPKILSELGFKYPRNRRKNRSQNAN